VDIIKPTSTTATIRRSGSLVASAVIILLFILSATGSAIRKPVTQGFDEVAHVSYVAYLQAEHPAWPQLERMKLIDPVSFEFTTQANYLNHLPFYYGLIAVLGPRIEGHPSALIYLRLLNVAIGAIGLIGLLALGARMRLTDMEFYAFAVMTAATPVLAPLAGSVNNDNLGFAGGAFTLLGAYSYVASQKRAWLIVACGGMVVASASKLTGLMLCGGLLAALTAFMALKRTSNKTDIAIVAASLVVAAAPYVAFILQYGNPAPNTPAQLELLRSGANTAGWATAPRMGAFGYSLMFLKSFLFEWMPSLQPRNDLQLALLALPGAELVMAAAGTMLCFRSLVADRGGSSAPIVAAGMLATLATLAIHVAFSYQRHLQTGWMMDAYPRYYLPVLALVPMAALAFTSAVPSPQHRTMLLAFLIAAPLVFGLLGAPIG
jgi:hypothetical protein